MAGFLHGVEFITLTEGYRPIQVARSSIVGLVGTAPQGTPNTPILVKSLKEGWETFVGSTTDLTGYTIPQALKDIFAQGNNVAMVVVINVYNPDVHMGGVTDVTETDIVGGVDGTTGKKSGIEALLDAEAVTGYKPKVLIAPGFGDASTVRDALIAKADALRAIAVLEVAQGTLPAGATADANTIGSDRAILLYPYLSEGGNLKPPSPAYAGVISRTDNELGFWYSPSNKLIYGFDGLEIPIDFGLSNPNSTANTLNEGQVCTFVAYQGWRTWGNYTCASDSQFKFITTRRIMDMIADTIELNILSFIDRPITKAFLEDLQDFENAYLNTLKGRGALVDAKCYILPENNPPEQIANGQIVVDLTITPVYPAERITHQLVIDIEPLKELFEG